MGNSLAVWPDTPVWGGLGSAHPETTLRAPPQPTLQSTASGRGLGGLGAGPALDPAQPSPAPSLWVPTSLPLSLGLSLPSSVYPGPLGL